MPSTKVNKIDVRSTYPCPCCKHGHLSLILLTDALGCDQCHHIFVVKPDGYTIEQCSAHYPPKNWYWTGRYWHLSRTRKYLIYWQLFHLLLGLGIVVVLFFPTVFPFFLSMELRIFMALIMAFMLWSSLNRR